MVLDGDLPEREPERRRRIRVKHLGDLLQLHEVIARTDRAEPDSGELPHRPRKLTAHAVGAAEVAELHPTRELDPIDVLPVDAEPLSREG